MKPVKAIDLVWKARPLVATLRQAMASLAEQKPNNKDARTLQDDCDEWLNGARTLLDRKGAK